VIARGESSVFWKKEGDSFTYVGRPSAMRRISGRKVRAWDRGNGIPRAGKKVSCLGGWNVEKLQWKTRPKTGVDWDRKGKSPRGSIGAWRGDDLVTQTLPSGVTYAECVENKRD